jgi:hypothetical protein
MDRRTPGIRLGIALGLVASAGFASMGLTGCAGAAVAGPSKAESAAKLEPIGDTGIKKIILTGKAVARLAMTTFPVAAQPDGRTVVPYRSLLYLPNGKPFVYTNLEPAVYVRQEVAVESIRGERVVLTAGPPVGTPVVTTGGAELWGTEFGVK